MEKENKQENIVSLGSLSTQLTYHIYDEDEKHREIKNSIDKMDASIVNLKENHLAHLKDDVTLIKTDLAKNSIDTEWLKKFFWLIAGASIGSMIASILNLVIKSRV